jgi:membrane protease YdiL (CAAX protease family)
MDSENRERPSIELPFNNLFLNGGFVSGKNNWYLYISTISFTILCYLLAPSISSIHLLLIAIGKNIDIDAIKTNPDLLYDYKWMGVDRNLILIALFGIFVFTLLGFRFALKRFQFKALINVLTAYEKLRYRRIGYGFVVWSLIVFLSIIIEWLVFPGQYQFVVNIGGILISILLLFVFVPIQAGFEEMFFRGFLMQGFALWFKNGWLPLIVTSLLFGLAHMSNPEVAEYGWPLMLSYYFLFALFMGLITLLDEGLELAIGIHIANNLVASVLVCSDHSVIKTYSILSEKGGNPNFEIVTWLIFATIVFLIFKRKYKWNNFKLILK